MPVDDLPIPIGSPPKRSLPFRTLEGLGLSHPVRHAQAARAHAVPPRLLSPTFACTATGVMMGAITSPILGRVRNFTAERSEVCAGTATAIPGTPIFATSLRFDDKWQPHRYLGKRWNIADDGLSVTRDLSST